MFRIVFWDELPCKIIVDRRFKGAYCLHHQGWWELEISQDVKYFAQMYRCTKLQNSIQRCLALVPT
jgi:hypothetical protein